MINTSIKQYILLACNIIFALSLALILATPFIIGKDLANAIVSSKYFWFYVSIALTALLAIPFYLINYSKIKFKIQIPDILLILFCTIALAVTIYYENRFNTKSILLILLLVFYFYLRIFLSVKSKVIGYILTVCFITTGLVEAAWGLLQLYGITHSGHNLFKITGSFFNPGPYSGWLAIVFPVAGYYLITDYKVFKIKKLNLKYLPFYFRWGLSVITLILILLILPAAMSRAAWLGALGGCAFLVITYWLSKTNVSEFFKKNKTKVLITASGTALLFVVLMIGLFLMKKDSASGRAFTWKVSMLTIKEHPTGVGLGYFSGTYGDMQAQYFAAGNGTEREEHVAGGVEYAFNEYLQVGVETGILGLIVFIAFIIYTLYIGTRNKNYVYVASFITLLIFASMSYPFNLLPFAIAFAFLAALCVTKNRQDSEKSKFNWKTAAFIFIAPVIVALCVYYRYPSYYAYQQWNKARILQGMGLHKETTVEYARRYNYLQDDIKFLFDYAQAAHNAKLYDDSNKVLSRAVQISCDPMLHNLMGRNYLAIKEYNKAEKSFIKSANLVPHKLYPHYLLVQLYYEMELPEKVMSSANVVLTKKPKVDSKAVEEMKEEVQKIIDSVNIGVYKQNTTLELKE